MPTDARLPHFVRQDELNSRCDDSYLIERISVFSLPKQQ
jgi:hypothetical protein